MTKRVGTVSIELALLHEFEFGLICRSAKLEEGVVATFVKSFVPQREVWKKTK